jgi:hypothetical protein
MAFVVVVTGWLVSQPMPALQDFGEWVFQSWAMLGLLRGDAAMHAQFAAAWFPVPNLLTQWLLVGTGALLGPFLAAKVLVAVYCVGATGVCALAARRFRPLAWGETFVVLLAVAAFNSCFWHGYANYQVGVVLFLLFLERTWNRPIAAWVLGGWGLLFYACHGSVLIAFFLLMIVREWRRWRVLLALAPVALLFAMYLVRRQPGTANRGTTFSLLSHVAYKGYTLVKAGPYQNLVDARGMSALVQPMAYHAGVVLNVGFGLTIAGVLIWGLWRGARAVPLSLLMFWSGLLGLVLVLPADTAEVVNLGERFLYLLLVSMLLLLPQVRWVRLLGCMCLLGFALTAAQLPRCSLSGWNAAEAFHQPPEAEGRAYRGDGLFSHRLYQNDERRVEMRDGAWKFDPLLFDTWMLKERAR